MTTSKRLRGQKVRNQTKETQEVEAANARSHGEGGKCPPGAA